MYLHWCLLIHLDFFFFRITPRYFIGLRKDEAAEPNVYRWLDGELVSWVNWDKVEHDPERNCAHLGDQVSKNATWMRYDCNNKCFAVCEIPRF